MKLSQLIFGFLLLYLSALGLYAGFTTQPKNWLVIGFALFFMYLAVVYLVADLTDYSRYLRDNVLNIDVEAKNFFRSLIAFLIVGLGVFALYKFFSIPILLGFVLLFLLATVYVYRTPMPGIYKNGKYLGIVHKGFIKIGDNLTLGKKQNVETIGFLKIIKDGKEVVKLVLTAEGFIELKPDKIWKVFPEIKGKIERFEGKTLFKVGDYTLNYEIVKGKNTEYYEEELKRVEGIDTSRDETFTSPLYGGIYSGNIWS
ncbi:MAG: hypothetical protein Q9M89_08175 [Persephonella sp.]|nr:hypothetical protein [Persephonella sp.]